MLPISLHILQIFKSYYRLSWIEVNGTVYKKGVTVILDMDLLPNFGTIVDIVVINTDMYYLVCETLVTDCFSHHHFHAIQVQRPQTSKYVCIKQSELYDYSVLSTYTLSTHPDLYFVPLKYQLIENV